jgi:hypothetical protein
MTSRPLRFARLTPGSAPPMSLRDTGERLVLPPPRERGGGGERQWRETEGASGSNLIGIRSSAENFARYGRGPALVAFIYDLIKTSGSSEDSLPSRYRHQTSISTAPA